jgi:TRAP-type mannitol/chloroaromatic compound transport system substrate-binding protein
MLGRKIAIATFMSVMMASPAFATERLSMATPWPGGLSIESMQRMSTSVKDLTKGEVEIEVLVGGSIGSALKVTEAVSKGLADAGHNWSGYDWGIDTTSMLFSGYAGSPRAEIMLHWLTQGGGDELLADWRMEKFGVVAFPCGVGTAEVGMISTKRIQKLDDFKGVKMRTSGAWAEIGAGLGMSTVSMAGSEIYPALERGVIDALEWGSLSDNLRAGFHQIAKYNIFPALHQPAVVYECQFNKKVWERLGEHNRKVIKFAAGYELRNAYEVKGNRDADAYQTYVDANVEFVVLDDEVINKAAELTAEWSDVHASKNAWFQRVLEHQRAYTKKWRASHIYR